MSEYFYPDSVWNIAATDTPYWEGDWKVNFASSYGYWGGSNTERDLGSTLLGYITDDDTQTKITCDDLLWLSYASEFKYWGWWLKVITSTPRLCDSFKFEWYIQDNDVKRFQIKLLPSGLTKNVTFSVAQQTLQETIWTFESEIVESASIRFMNHGTASNSWNAYVNEVAFGAYTYPVVRTQDFVTGITYYVNPENNTFLSELTLGGLEVRWQPTDTATGTAEKPSPTMHFVGMRYELDPSGKGMIFYDLYQDAEGNIFKLYTDYTNPPPSGRGLGPRIKWD